MTTSPDGNMSAVTATFWCHLQIWKRSVLEALGKAPTALLFSILKHQGNGQENAIKLTEETDDKGPLQSQW